MICPECGGRGFRLGGDNEHAPCPLCWSAGEVGAWSEIGSDYPIRLQFGKHEHCIEVIAARTLLHQLHWALGVVDVSEAQKAIDTRNEGKP